MSCNFILFSIRPRYANKILQGNKTVELRRNCPRAKKDDLVLIYASSPMKALIGAFKVDRIVEKPPQDLWHIVKQYAAISRKEFDAYYTGAPVGFGIFFNEVHGFREPVKLQRLREWWSSFHPPQRYCYLTKERVKAIYSLIS